MNKDRFSNMINELLELKLEKPDDYWGDRAKIPLFSKRPFYEYEDGIVPIEDVITLSVDRRDAQSRKVFNCLVCASTGVGKSRLTKNVIKGFWKQGYKILIIEPKGNEMLNARKKGKAKRIHHLDKNEKLPVVSYVPNYAKAFLTINKRDDIIKKTKFYSPDVRLMNYREIWMSLGVPAQAADMITEMVSKGHTKVSYFLTKLMQRNLHPSTRRAVDNSLNNLLGTKFFANNKKLELKKEWDKKNIVTVNYYSQDGVFMNTDIGLILDSVRDIGIEEMRGGLRNVSKKLLIFDDAFYYAGMSAALANKSGGMNLAARNISNCQNNFRTWGVDTMFIVQSPDSNSVLPNLIDGCTTKLISYIENPLALQAKLPYQAFELLRPSKPDRASLFIDEDKYTFQWIMAQGKTKWEIGFPFDVTVGHI